ncbi:hypothetical protein KC332_g1875 [Hortaea werneckii]|uniref:YCII-related domain-containing protein n=1 Tax=Hortaea werneckii EXF-2000 TaxID=1157616 RepID=A0A1Z5SU57_HORWE|nr:hypothetical protein KC358_g1162 [Hortaea werneckii]OTA24298.1 hypothetical protein BTJ68_11812 [Hortaea werneckii EXF-2000]KAI6851489.1 hypothetical protein KC350_g1605 [Hortaea werneckii]KAI6939292.1 hypothetical protein KC341_g4296 [Hortaea werneckii]KAI6949176.1 hypothetical protein KC348_g1494 [Hortaea werneckii]
MVLRPSLLSSLLTKRFFSTTYRKMAPKQEWMVILPDAAGKLSKRMEVRPDHLNNLKPHVDSGLWVFGGASLDEPIKEGEPPKINGSVMLAVADTKEEVMKSVKEDVYFKSGVWDESKIQIFPFKSAIREQLPKA